MTYISLYALVYPTPPPLLLHTILYVLNRSNKYVLFALTSFHTNSQKLISEKIIYTFFSETRADIGIERDTGLKTI
jgi:hypothetical protein